MRFPVRRAIPPTKDSNRDKIANFLPSAQRRTAGKDLKDCELGRIAAQLSPRHVQTIRLFAWATGCRSLAEVTEDSIAKFAAVFRSTPASFGRRVEDFAREPSTVMAACQKSDKPRRAEAMIDRHCGRIRTILAGASPLSPFERRSTNGVLKPTSAETMVIEGWSEGTAFVVVVDHERDRISAGRRIESFDRARAERSGLTAQWGRWPRWIFDEISTITATLGVELDRVCVMTRHGDQLRGSPIAALMARIQTR